MSKTKKRDIGDGRAGFALGTVMIFLAAFIIFAAASYRVMSAAMISSLHQQKRTAAFYIAEAGLEDALQVLSDSMTWNTWSVGFTTKAFSGGFYAVTVSTLTPPFTIASSGELPGKFPSDRPGRAAIRVNITTNPGLFNHALGALGFPGHKGLTLTNSVVIGETYDANTANPLLPAPVIDDSILLAEATASSPCANGNVSFTGVTATLGPNCISNGGLTITASTITLMGTLYVDRDLVMNNGVLTGMHAVYIGRNISILNGSVVGSTTPNNSPFIYSPVPGNSARIEINNSAVHRTAIYAPYAHMDIIDSTVSGSLIAGNAQYTNAGKPGVYNSTATWTPIYYPPGLGGAALTVLPGSWDEAY